MELLHHYEIVDNQCFLPCGPCFTDVNEEGKTVYIRPLLKSHLFDCNVLIIPIVDHMRETYGIYHEVDLDTDSLVPSENGKYKLVPEDVDGTMYSTYLAEIKRKLLEMLDGNELTEEQKFSTVRVIMKMRFLRETSFIDSLSYEQCVHFIVAYIGIESCKGYNPLMVFLSENSMWPSEYLEIGSSIEQE